MATRLYYVTTSPNGALTPAVDAAWEKSTSLVRRKMARASGGNTGNGNGIAGSGSNPNDTIREQFISDPLAAQTLSPGGAWTCKGQIMVKEVAGTDNAQAQLGIRVVAEDGTVRGTMLALHTSALSSEWATAAYTNRKFPKASLSPAALSEVVCQNGDRLVVEMGARFTSTATSNASMRYVSGASDLPEDETATTDGHPWLEISGDILFGIGIAGASTDSGGLQRQANVAYAGASTDSGALAKAANVAYAGASTDSGALANAFLSILAVSGTSANSGDLANLALATLLASGSSANSGNLIKDVAAFFAGTSTNTGGMTQTRNIELAGASTNIGILELTFVYPPLTYRKGRRLVQMHAFLYSPDANGGPGTLKADLTPDLLNTFWQRSMNLSGQSAFALSRSNEKNALIVPGVDHIELWRETPSAGATRVFQGKLMEPSVAAGDTVWRAIDYMGFLQRSRTGYKTLYHAKKIGTEIISPEWVLAKTVADSPLAFVATGTIQDPLGIDAVTPIVTNNKFGLMLFDRLFTFFALAEMSMVNTTNNVVFEITTAATPTFNLWKNRSTDRDTHTFSFPGNLTAFHYAPGYMQLVNDMASVVKKTGGGQEEYVVEDAASIATYRRLQSAVAIQTLMGLESGGTESDQMKAAVQRLLIDALRLPKLFVAVPRYNEIEPLIGWDLGDNFMTFVEKAGDPDADEVAAYLRVVSVAASWRPEAGESVQLYMRGKE